jgi:hypothetical protein
VHQIRESAQKPADRAARIADIRRDLAYEKDSRVSTATALNLSAALTSSLAVRLVGPRGLA